MQPINTNDHDRLTRLCNEAAIKISKIVPLAGAASGRRYYRLYPTNEPTIIGTIGPSAKENAAFCYLSRHMAAKGLPVPDIIAVSDDKSAYIQSDLGDRSLLEAISPGSRDGKWEGEPTETLRKAIVSLPAMQFATLNGLDQSRCLTPAKMDRREVMRDLEYFRFCFLRQLNIEVNDIELDLAFDRLADMVAGNNTGVAEAFSLRDCQSRNVIIDNDGNPHWIDYQSGRLAPVTYDLASLLWQSRAKIPDHIRAIMVDEYFAEMQKYAPDTRRENFDKSLRLMVIIRLLQVLGAYGLRGLSEGKVQFLESIPNALHTLLTLLDNENDDAMHVLCNALKEAERHPWCTVGCTIDNDDKDTLTVDVCSFSYKRGMPRYRSMHGGGFVFDCRAPHNPGRYEHYRSMTGMDTEVIEFIEADGELPELLRHAEAMVGAAIERYQERGFKSLSVAFGCTGGRHRSVYSAEHMARYINDRYGVKVNVSHTNLGINYQLQSRI